MNCDRFSLVRNEAYQCLLLVAATSYYPPRFVRLSMAMAVTFFLCRSRKIKIKKVPNFWVFSPKYNSLTLTVSSNIRPIRQVMRSLVATQGLPRWKNLEANWALMNFPLFQI
ncbi:hypothetical protein V8G54_008580, partial [Vigna mungo]